MRKRGRAAHLISSVASTYNIHPQTLRLYERQGLLKPSRSEGNTRLYTDEDLERLEVILNLTRDLGVNLAGVEIILNMRERMEAMEDEIREFMSYVQREFGVHSAKVGIQKDDALVRRPPPSMVRFNR
ncbi:MAG: MerR family transcriptional regulator [Acidimicrobiia bacterium]|nr:MerR family transcriptional regulator [Acidimicrobiia bacterium]